jgi:hypothetical protein
MRQPYTAVAPSGSRIRPFFAQIGPQGLYEDAGAHLGSHSGARPMDLIEQYIPPQEYLIVAAVVLAGLFILTLVFRALAGRRSGAESSRLGISEYLEVDKQRRLVLVRRDDVEHLVLIGGGHDIVIEAVIRPGVQRREDFPAGPRVIPGDRLQPERERPLAGHRSDGAVRPVPIRTAPRQGRYWAIRRRPRRLWRNRRGPSPDWSRPRRKTRAARRKSPHRSAPWAPVRLRWRSWLVGSSRLAVLKLLSRRDTPAHAVRGAPGPRWTASQWAAHRDGAN